MLTISASAVSDAELTAVKGFVDKLPERSELRAALQAVTDSVRSGVDVVMGRESDAVSPAVAARLIGVSRTHLYKLLDSGAIPAHRVGRDRRVRLADLEAFRSDQDALRKDVAERFAHADQARAKAIQAFAAHRAR